MTFQPVGGPDGGFAGVYEVLEDGLDFVCVFDGRSFKLEPLAGQVKTR